jgi:uncharacterized protein YjbI with pentapeptide repeats
MHLKAWGSLLCTVPMMTVPLLATSLVLGSHMPAQAVERNQRELYILCTRSPYNSRCEGQDWPTLMDDRPGATSNCAFLRGEFDEMDTCKVNLEPTAVVIYREIGDPIPELEGQRDTIAIEIPVSQIFAVNTRLWSVRNNGLLTAWSDDDKASLSLSYVSSDGDRSAEDTGDRSNMYRTNVLTFFTDAEAGFTFSDQLMQVAPTSRAESVATQIATPTTPVAGAAIEQLKETGDCPRCDLRNADLSEADLDEANLEGANLEGANLAGADLSEAYLIGANLNQANLTAADLSVARLTLATLVGANLQEANLASADLQWADLRSANLSNVEAELSIMQEINLSQANLREADLEGVNLMRANLEGADLSAADLSVKAPSQLSSFSGGALGLGVSLLLGASTTYRFVTDLSGANLRSVNLTDANLEDVVFRNADLAGANLTNINLEDTDLSAANLCGTLMPDGSQSNQGC